MSLLASSVQEQTSSLKLCDCMDAGGNCEHGVGSKYSKIFQIFKDQRQKLLCHQIRLQYFSKFQCAVCYLERKTRFILKQEMS